MPKPLHRLVVTHRGIYTKVLHTDAADASTHKCFSTQKHLPRYALTYTRLYTQKLLDTDCFFTESQKLWHREAFTQRIFYTQKLLQTSFSTEAFTQRSFWAQEPLHTDAFTHRSLYTRRLLRTEAFTQRSLYTQMLPHRKTDSTGQPLHIYKSQFYVSVWRSAIISCERVASGFGKSQFLTWDNHFAWKGHAWTCKIAILHKFYFSRNACAWRFKMDKVAVLHHFLNVCIWC